MHTILAPQPDEQPVIQLSDIIDVESPEYKETRSRIEALLISSTPEGSKKMPNLQLQLNGSLIESHVSEDFFIAAHALGLDIADINAAIHKA